MKLSRNVLIRRDKSPGQVQNHLSSKNNNFSFFGLIKREQTAKFKTLSECKRKSDNFAGTEKVLNLSWQNEFLSLIVDCSHARGNFMLPIL